MIIVKNNTTDHTVTFDTDNNADCYAMGVFLRNAVLDFVLTSQKNSLTLDDGMNITITDESPEIAKWIYAGMLYQKCLDDEEWGDIVTIYEVEEIEDEEF